MDLVSAFDMFTNDPYDDAMLKKDKMINDAGQGTILELINLPEDYAAAKTALETIVAKAIFNEVAPDPKKPRIVSPKDLPAPDI